MLLKVARMADAIELSLTNTSLYAVSPNVMLMGDFNMHMHFKTPFMMDFPSYLDSLQQFSDFPTHCDTYSVLFAVLGLPLSTASAHIQGWSQSVSTRLASN